jgi:hypothetical protein
VQVLQTEKGSIYFCTIQWNVCHELGEKFRAPLHEEGPEDLGCAVREEQVDLK